MPKMKKKNSFIMQEMVIFELQAYLLNGIEIDANRIAHTGTIQIKFKWRAVDGGGQLLAIE